MDFGANGRRSFEREGLLNFVWAAFFGIMGKRIEDKTKLETALDELLAGKTTEEIVGPNGLLKQLTKALVEHSAISCPF